MTRTQTMQAWALAAVAAGAACASGAASVTHRDGVDGLEAFFASVAAACNAGDFAKGKAITLAVVPTRDDLKKALKDDVESGIVDQILEIYRQLPSTDARMACLFTPGEGRTEIKAYASTTEAIRAYAPGTPAFEEFPGGARTLAERILRPGVTFYEVEVTKPGEPSGVKFHLFFWNGRQWRMLGPAWRVLK